MKKITLILGAFALIAAVACNKPAENAEEATTEAVEATTEAVEAPAEAAPATTEATTEAVEAAPAEAAEAVKK